jgi:hypothetical protein
LARKNLPVSGNAPPPALDNPENAKKDEMYPITDRISHAFLFNYRIDYDPKPGTFVEIGTTQLPPLVAGAGPNAGADAPTLGGQTQLVAAGRDAWKPLTGSGGGGPGGIGPGDMANMSRGSKFKGGFGVVSEGSGLSGGAPSGTSTQAATNADLKKGKPRYEFIVMFIWREPTPSDALMKSEGAPQ